MDQGADVLINLLNGGKKGFYIPILRNSLDDGLGLIKPWTAEKIQKDADLQSALMPQELNPEFVSEEDSPWRAVLPIRQKRDTTEILNTDTTIAQLKRYSRIIAYVVLALSAAVEITVYLVETYYVPV